MLQEMKQQLIENIKEAKERGYGNKRRLDLPIAVSVFRDIHHFLR